MPNLAIELYLNADNYNYMISYKPILSLPQQLLWQIRNRAKEVLRTIPRLQRNIILLAFMDGLLLSNSFRRSTNMSYSL